MQLRTDRAHLFVPNPEQTGRDLQRNLQLNLRESNKNQTKPGTGLLLLYIYIVIYSQLILSEWRAFVVWENRQPCQQSELCAIQLFNLKITPCENSSTMNIQSLV